MFRCIECVWFAFRLLHKRTYIEERDTVNVKSEDAAGRNAPVPFQVRRSSSDDFVKVQAAKEIIS